MAKYDNRFLVQYFKDIYALYILRGKLRERIRVLNVEIDQLRRGKYQNSPPVQKSVAEGNSGCLFGVAGFSAFAVIVCLLIINLGFWYVPLILIIYLIVGVVSFGAAISDKSATRQENETAQATYRYALEKYEEIERENERCRQEIPLLQNSVAYYEQELRKVDALIQNAYSINIIPNQYRDLYTVVYLYDYFEGSRETDLAMALNTYVLEQIKERLDRIISQLSEMILNQYTMIQNQHMAVEEAHRYHIDMKDRLSRIEATNEERNVYLDMIESNTATLRYFATVDYLTK